MLSGSENGQCFLCRHSCLCLTLCGSPFFGALPIRQSLWGRSKGEEDGYCLCVLYQKRWIQYPLRIQSRKKIRQSKSIQERVKKNEKKSKEHTKAGRSKVQSPNFMSKVGAAFLRQCSFFQRDNSVILPRRRITGPQAVPIGISNPMRLTDQSAYQLLHDSVQFYAHFNIFYHLIKPYVVIQTRTEKSTCLGIQNLHMSFACTVVSYFLVSKTSYV